MLVQDIMNKSVIICTEDTPLSEVYQLMEENNCKYISVVESETTRTPIGFITEHDICSQIIGHGHDPRNLTARHVMNPNVVRTLRTSNLRDCADLMAKNQTNQICVIDEHGFLCGTLTELDIEATRTKQHIEDLFTRAISKKFSPLAADRIF